MLTCWQNVLSPPYLFMQARDASLKLSHASFLKLLAWTIASCAGAMTCNTLSAFGAIFLLKSPPESIAMRSWGLRLLLLSLSSAKKVHYTCGGVSSANAKWEKYTYTDSVHPKNAGGIKIDVSSTPNQ